MLELIKDLTRFFKKTNKMWLLPLVLALLIFGFLLVLSQGSALAPLIYTLF